MSEIMKSAKQPAPPAALAVVEWLLTGGTEMQIREALRIKYPEEDENQIMNEVKSQLEIAGKPSRDAVKGWAIMSLRLLYQKSFESGDYDGCRKMIKEITTLCK